MKIENGSGRILVVAFKYNDILYALGTTEYQSSTYKKLVVFYIEGRNPKDFPLQDAFDEVVYVKYLDGIKNLWRNLIKIKSMQWDCDVLTYSNPILLATKLITKLSYAKTVIWLEDGLMNYYPLTDIRFTTSRTLKQAMQAILRLNDQSVFDNKLLVTYLLCPNMAVSYWGELRLLNFDKVLFNNKLLDMLSFVEGKKLFIGQPLYNTAGISKKIYTHCVNKVISNFKIDYYVPHYGSQNEDIHCEYLNLQDYHITFEFLACAYNFTIYSVNSTLLYSTKKINPKVRSFMVYLNGVDNNIPILKNTVNGIINPYESEL